MDAQREQLEELYEGKINILKELLTDHYQEEMQVCSGQSGKQQWVGKGLWVLESRKNFMKSERFCFLRYFW